MKTVSFGEIMLRLKAPGHERLFQGNRLETSFCGAEANVAVSLANYGADSHYVSILPDNAIGDACIRELRSWNVKTEAIAKVPGRMGILFLEAGANQRPSQVMYDRCFSALAQAASDSIDWEEVLINADWFHISGITPALSPQAAEIAFSAVKTAKRNGVTVSCDLNYRKNLWNYGKTATEVMPSFVELTDVLIANEEDIQNALGITTGFEVDSVLDSEKYEELAQKVFAVYGNLQKIAITLRESHSADWNDWSACLFEKNACFISKKYSIRNIVDRVGGGDSFAAGLIYGLNHYAEKQSAIEFAVAASCLKHSILGDFARISAKEVETLMNSEGTGRIVR
ncbi:MAG: sugar kinase [Oscillospiraceae bacterium]|nr:sugar kinase [Oscillospiraceae bacterium]